MNRGCACVARCWVTRSPQKALLTFSTTLSEETGPVFSQAIIGARDIDLLHNHAVDGESAIGPRILVYGQVRDQAGQGLPDTLIAKSETSGGYRFDIQLQGPAETVFSDV